MFYYEFLIHVYSYAKSVPNLLTGKRLTILHKQTGRYTDMTDRMTIHSALHASRLEQK
jgi:hypothetical protein